MAKFTQKDPEIIRRALQLCEKLGDPKAAAEELRAQLKGEGREDEAPAWRTIYYWRNKDKGARPPGKMPIARRDRKARGSRSAIPERAAMATDRQAASQPPTEAERKVDELVAKSRTWRRVCEALGRFASKYPQVAIDLAAELRGLNL